MKVWKALALVACLVSPSAGFADTDDSEQLDFLYGPTPPPGKPFGVDGHLYTTFIVATLAGLPVDRATELCWGSQVPDERKDFDAVWAAIPTIFGSRFHRNLMSTLHSLHGGDEEAVKKRRADLQALIRRLIDSHAAPDWQVGLIIHAFGDSYAHTVEEAGKIRAYGYPLGHALHGHGPDVIANDRQKYLEYASALYFGLTGRSDASTQLRTLYAKVPTLSKDRHQAERQMQKFAAELGLTSERNKKARDRWVQEITPINVEKTMAIINASFD